MLFRSGMAMTLREFLPQVLGLFDDTLRALLDVPFLALLLGLLVFLLIAGMFRWLMYVGRRKL